MALSTVTTGNVILAADVNQLVFVLQRQSGQTETGKYYLEAGLYTTGAFLGQYMSSLSRVSVPVSVTIDEADVAHTNNANAASTQSLTANGFQVHCNSSAANTDAKVAGNTTINF